MCVWYSFSLLYWYKSTNTDAACVSATSACRRASGLAPSVWAKVLVVYLLYWYNSTNILTLRALSCKTPSIFVLFVPVAFVLLYQNSKATATLYLYFVPVTDSARALLQDAYDEKLSHRISLLALLVHKYKY